VSLANIDVLEREQLVPRVRELEPLLAATLAPLADHALVKEVRSGLGLLGAVELHDPTKLAAVVAATRDRGVLTRIIRGVALQFSPPFVVTEDELAQIGAAVAGALDAVAHQ